MKKILSILMMVLLMFGAVPLVVAENADNQDTVTVTQNDDGDLVVSTDVEEPDEPETDEDTDTEEPEDDEVTRRPRKVSAKQLREASKDFSQAKQAYQRASKDSKESRESFLQDKKQLRACDSEESEECVALSEQVNQHAKDLVLNGIDGAIEHLNQLKAKLESSEDVENVADIIANIDNSIAELEAAKAEVEAAESKAEIKNIARSIKKLWSRIRNKERVYAAKLVNSKVFNIIKRAEKLEVKLERLVARLEAKGVDVTTLEESLAEFNTNIEAARAKYEEGKALIGEDAKLARRTIKEAHNLVKKAHNALMDLVRNFRNVGSDVSDADEEEEEEEEETEVEVEGDIELSEEAQATLDELVASFEGVDYEVEINLKVVKEKNETEVEVEVEGDLTAEQQILLDTLQDQVKTLVSEAEGDEIKLEIEIEHEVEEPEEPEEEEEEEEEPEEPEGNETEGVEQ